MKRMFGIMFVFAVWFPIIGYAQSAKLQENAQALHSEKILQVNEDIRDATVRQAEATEKQASASVWQTVGIVGSLLMVVAGWYVNFSLQIRRDKTRDQIEANVLIQTAITEIQAFSDTYIKYLGDTMVAEVLSHPGKVIILKADFHAYPEVAKNIGKIADASVREVIMNAYSAASSFRFALDTYNDLVDQYMKEKETEHYLNKIWNLEKFIKEQAHIVAATFQLLRERVDSLLNILATQSP